MIEIVSVRTCADQVTISNHKATAPSAASACPRDTVRPIANAAGIIASAATNTSALAAKIPPAAPPIALPSAIGPASSSGNSQLRNPATYSHGTSPVPVSSRYACSRYWWVSSAQ